MFDKMVDLTCENEKLQTEVCVLGDNLEKVYEFMRRLVIIGRSRLDVFREQIGVVKECIHKKFAEMGR